MQINWFIIIFQPMFINILHYLCNIFFFFLVVIVKISHVSLDSLKQRKENVIDFLMTLSGNIFRIERPLSPYNKGLSWLGAQTALE